MWEGIVVLSKFSTKICISSYTIYDCFIRPPPVESTLSKMRPILFDFSLEKGFGRKIEEVGEIRFIFVTMVMVEILREIVLGGILSGVMSFF